MYDVRFAIKIRFAYVLAGGYRRCKYMPCDSQIDRNTNRKKEPNDFFPRSLSLSFSLAPSRSEFATLSCPSNKWKMLYLLALAVHTSTNIAMSRIHIHSICTQIAMKRQRAAVAVEATAMTTPVAAEWSAAFVGVDGKSALRFNGYGLPCPWTALCAGQNDKPLLHHSIYRMCARHRLILYSL